MARTVKKKKELTVEEKLAEALVPLEEQPYRVPENWCWTKLRTISFHISDGSHNPPKNSGKGVPLLSATNIHDRIIDFEQTARWITEAEWTLENERTQIEVGDILLTIVATIGRVAVVTTEKPFALQRSVATIKPKIDAQYLSYYFESPYIQTFMNTNAKGTAQKGFYLNSLENLFCALPPLPEQQRIVDRIESLFAKLDEAKEKAQAVVDGFEEIKQAFLYQAFYGNLTEQWRKSSRIDKKQTWRTKSLQSVCAMKITDGTHKTPTYCNAEEGVPFISAKDVTSGVICWDNIKYIIPKLHEELYERLAPQVDDVLLAKNGTTGVAAIVEEEKIFDLYVTLAVLRPNKDIIDPRYLLNVVNSPICKRQFDEHLTGIGVPNLHLRDIKEVEIPLPSLGEQKEIVRIIDSMSEKWKESQGAAEQVISQIDTMKKSILARAFRGELGTNDPADESAVELLKRIL